MTLVTKADILFDHPPDKVRVPKGTPVIVLSQDGNKYNVWLPEVGDRTISKKLLEEA